MSSGDDVLKAYPRAVAHLWRQLQDERLGFILGAGVSLDYKIPVWSKLVKAVAEHPSVRAGTGYFEPLSLPLPILTEVLFQRYCEGARSAAMEKSANLHDVDRLLLAGWRRVIHEVLYSAAPTTSEEIFAIDSGLKHLLHAIKKSVLTVTYNFDDILERLLLKNRTSGERSKTLSFQTVVDARVPFRRDRTIILHPNGYLPHNLLESSNDTLVFSEGSFADQMIDVMAGQFSTILHYLTKSTFVLVGLSLEDETLRHLLRQSALLSPGNYHYYIRYVRDPSALSAEARRAEVETNFNVYNLVTLHLDENGIKGLGDLLAMKKDDLVTLAEDLGVPVHYSYFLTGVPGVGKTTTFSYFNSLVTQDEWTEPRLPLMSLPYTSLDESQTAVVDTWIMAQYNKKNQRMLAEANKGIGIMLVDRCLPDAITFTEPDEWAAKANEILKAVSPGATKRKLHDGHVIMLEADPSEIVVRAALREKKTDEAYTCQLMVDLRTIYESRGTTTLHVGGMTPTEVAKKVARVVLFEDYQLAALDERVVEVAEGSVEPPARISVT